MFVIAKNKTILGLAALALTTSCMQEPELGNNLPETFEEFEATVYHEPFEGGVYLVDGDTPVETREQLREFYQNLAWGGELIVNTTSGGDDRWDDATKNAITYCVSQSSFGANYDRVVTAMNQAAGAWEAAADITFVHLSEKDGNCNQRTNGVIFDVRQVSSGQYLARAFFPSTSRRSRNVLIDTSTYFYDDDNSDPLSLVGVLRHELGHALGFRHEHTRPDSGVCFEDNNWRELTPYDSDSVMHYPQCNGTGNWSLTLTNSDKQGAADLYNGTTTDPPTDPPTTCDLAQVGESCTVDSDCCSNKCKGPNGNKTCK